MALKFKFVSSGQNVDDAAIVSQTIYGRSLTPLSPVNPRGERNLNNDLLMLWTQRSRIGTGMIAGSDVPIAEEHAEFAVEIYDGSTLKRTMNRILVGTPMPALLTAIAKDRYAYITGGGNSVDITDGLGHRFVSLQRISQGNNFVEGTLICDGNCAIYLGLLQANKDWKNLTYTSDIDFSVLLEDTSPVLSFWQAGAQLYSEDASAYNATGVRVRIAIEDDSVKFYKNYSGSGSQPLAVASAANLNFPYYVYISAGAGVVTTMECNDVMMTINPQPAAIYTEDQQSVDFGSAQSSVKTRIYQVSQIVGRGPYVEANL